MEKIIIIHGTGGSPDGNWFPWLFKELTTRGYQTFVPQMPTPHHQSLENWFEGFKKHNFTLDASTIVIGHSCGAVFLLRILEKMSNPIKGSIFVAGFTGTLNLPEFDLLNSTFVENPYDWGKIKKNAGVIKCYSGEDDPYVPKEQGIELARNLGVSPVLIRDGGHLNAGSGYNTFPLLFEQLQVMLDLA